MTVALTYPRGRLALLGPQTESRMLSHDIVCLHTMVGSLAGTDSMFGDDGFGGTESHFGTGGGGECTQWQDLAFTADANLDGAHRVISIENADKGPGFGDWGGSDVPRFTDAQAARLVDLLKWLCSKEAHARCPSTWACHKVGIPRAMVPDSLPGRRGIAVHRQGCDGNFPATGPLRGRVPGGERWSGVRGKVCPGDRRILQTYNEIIPALQEDPMSQYDAQLDRIEKDAREAVETVRGLVPVVARLERGRVTNMEWKRDVTRRLRGLKVDGADQRALLDGVLADLDADPDDGDQPPVKP